VIVDEPQRPFSASNEIRSSSARSLRRHTSFRCRNSERDADGTSALEPSQCDQCPTREVCQRARHCNAMEATAREIARIRCVTRSGRPWSVERLSTGCLAVANSN